MANQSRQAMEEADAILFMVDAREGLCATDEAIANYLRPKAAVVYLVANKIDGLDPDTALTEFYRLGLGPVYATTATHGRGVKSLLDVVVPDLPESVSSTSVASGIKIAVVGRPNVGKSTLVNRMLGEERVVVYDQPGTTRDSIHIDYQRDGKSYTLIDTAGIRRRKNVSLTVEKFSIVKTLQAIDDANVAILLIDAHEGLVDQDLHLMGHVITAGRALVVAINKWDGLPLDQRERIKQELQRRLRFADFVDVHFISARHGTGVGKLYQSIERAYAAAVDKLSTNRLTRILVEAVAEHPPPLVRGRRIKLRYAHAGGRNPPVIVIHGNQAADVPSHYARYLEKAFRRALELHGTPIRVEFKTGENPYADVKNKLSPRQIAHRRRLIQHGQR
jgi:GTP-binding protein